MQGEVKSEDDESNSKSVQTAITKKSNKTVNKSVNSQKSYLSNGSVRSQKGKIEPETIRLKKMIAKIKEENQNLMTKISKEKKEMMKKEKWSQDLEVIIERSKIPLDEQKKKQQKIKKEKKKVELSEQAKKAQELFNTQCICTGNKPVVRNGFCADCIESIKKEYEDELNSYKKEADEYENLYVGNFNTDNKIVKMKKKILSYQKKIVGLEDEEEDLDEKMMLEEIDYIRKSIKIIDSECIMLKKDHERQVKEKQSLQLDIETKLIKKEQKIEKLSQEIEEKEGKVDNLKNKIEQVTATLLKLREDNL